MNMDDYNIVKAFDVIERELIASMLRNMDRHKAEESDRGIEWTQWQIEQMKALEQYKIRNQNKYELQFRNINSQIESLIKEARESGGMEQEIEILRAIKNGFKGYKKASSAMTAQFFRMNDRKLDALIKATVDDMKKAETAILRMANDKYRQIIFNAQVYANTGAGTYEKAVDMASKDMLATGLACVEYKNGARHTLRDYADMAIRTASKRAYLTGEGEKRKEWGITTVIMNKRGNPCPKCLPWVGKILIDDVWSGGKPSDGPYPLMSKAVTSGLYHPRCKDGHTTYFEGVSAPPDSKFTQKEIYDIVQEGKKEAQEQYAKRQQEKYERLAENSLDKENRKNYERKQKEWQAYVEKCGKTDIIKLTDEEQYALNQYLSFESYGINEKLRNGLKLNEREKKMAASLDSALKKLPHYEGDLSRSLYFGNVSDVEECIKKFKVDDDISFEEFISTTCGNELYNPDGEIQIIIKNAKSGRNLTSINENEQEVLYERGSNFKVKKVTEQNGKYWILMEER